MYSTDINEILQTISSLPTEDQYFIADTLSKRLHDIRRTQIATRGAEAEKNYQTGNVMSGAVADLMRATDDD